MIKVTPADVLAPVGMLCFYLQVNKWLNLLSSATEGETASEAALTSNDAGKAQVNET